MYLFSTLISCCEGMVALMVMVVILAFLLIFFCFMPYIKELTRWLKQQVSRTALLTDEIRLQASSVLGGPRQRPAVEQGPLPVQPQAGARGRGGVREAERGQLRGQQVRILGCDWSHAATILSCDWLSRVPSTIGTPIIGGSFRNISGLPR